MEILLAGFIDNLSFDKVSVDGIDETQFDITKIDITGLHYTQAYSLPSEANPHLLVLATQPEEQDSNATLIVEFIAKNSSTEPETSTDDNSAATENSEKIVARNVQPFPVEAKKFGYRLVMGKFEVEEEQTYTTRITIPEYNKKLEIPLIIKNKQGK